MSQAAVLDAVGASQYLGVARSTLARWRITGLGPKYCKIGGRVVYKISDLENYLSRHTIDPGERQEAAV